MASIASNTPRCDSRQNRFHTLFQGPNSAGKARQVMLWTVKKCNASKNLRSLRPLSPRRERAARNASTTIAQSASLIPVSMIGSPKPTAYESLMPPAVNPLLSTHQIPSTRPRLFYALGIFPAQRYGSRLDLVEVHQIDDGRDRLRVVAHSGRRTRDTSEASLLRSR